MITQAIFTTDPAPDAQLYFLDGVPYLRETFDWKKYNGNVIFVQIENVDVETIYNEERTGVDFLFTCLRRWNEVIGGKVQGFNPGLLIFGGNCQEFPHQGQSIRNYLMDLIGWETTNDPDEPLPITSWSKRSESGSKSSQGTNIQPPSQTPKNGQEELTSDVISWGFSIETRTGTYLLKMK